MASINQIGVAVVGTGFGQKIHIPGFQHHPRTEVVAVYNRDPFKESAKIQEILTFLRWQSYQCRNDRRVKFVL